jgi:hypothetical protein
MSGLVRSAANAVGGSNFSPFDVDSFAFDSQGPGDMDYLQCEPDEQKPSKDGESKEWIEFSNNSSNSETDEKSDASSEEDQKEAPIFGHTGDPFYFKQSDQDALLSLCKYQPSKINTFNSIV